MTEKLLSGFRKFRSEHYDGHNAIMPRLVQDGQDPDYFVISCIDSRSNPGTIFCAEPGAFLAHKAMGAIVRPYHKGTALAAALQFALIHNKVKDVIVLGHTGCGAIESLVNKINDDEIRSFIDVAQQGLQHAQERCANACTHDELLRYTEEEIVLQSVANLKTYPSVTQALSENRVNIRPWLFDMEHGDLMEYSYDQKKFISLMEVK
ncbi:MAG: hypothetical protein AUJ12_06195 [Alphaproteobacteria bacterium CG1_02_46_17]|nr:MAG: hypothetical protein AUJ12_06195 [Alphaproteobacteria bacterium CG1_02_46_17]